MSQNDQSPLGWLPKPGQSKKIPGGVLWCNEWEATINRSNQVSGKIIFHFETDLASYEIATQEPKAIEDSTPPLLSGDPLPTDH